MGILTLSPRRAAVLRRIRRRAWLLIGLSMIWQVVASANENAPIAVGAPAIAEPGVRATTQSDAPQFAIHRPGLSR